MVRHVNLDALIPREDFEITDQSSINRSGTKIERLSLRDLEKTTSFIYNNLRKPDFQRETNEWEPTRVCNLIESFVNGDLIPSVILWQCPGSYVFIIDGAHRLSALAAWVNNDFGDGHISKTFYDSIIPEEQIEVAEKTRTMIRKNLGSYEDFLLANTHPEKVKPDILTKLKDLGTRAIQLQWVEGNAEKAEASFFKINQQAVPINPTELKLLESRKFANGIAARAIIRSGKGHKYWSNFDPEKQKVIQNLAEEINHGLFVPKYESPIKTLDLPIGGSLFSAQTLPLILDFINIANSVNKKTLQAKDLEGNKTIEFLQNCRDIVQSINSNHPASLGLHPAIYFYSRDGRHKIASFYGSILLIIDFHKNKSLMNSFIKNRAVLESIIWDSDYLIQQIVRKHRGALKSAPYICSFYIEILRLIENGHTIITVIDALIKDKKFNYLIPLKPDDKTDKSMDFTREQKSSVFINEAVKNALKCKICGGLIHKNSITIDHIQRKTDGGASEVSNGQLAHPYCNTTFKN